MERLPDYYGVGEVTENGERNPWTTLETRMIYQNAWIRVREDQVLRPDGSPGIYGVVEARTATGVVALTDEGEIYLVGQYRYPIDRYSWEIVEGGAEPGESALEAIVRELKEEAGLSAERWIQLGPPVHLSNCFSNEEAIFFLARGLATVEASPDVTEILQLRKVPFGEALEMVRTGEISDAMSILAIVRADEYLKRGE